MLVASLKNNPSSWIYVYRTICIYIYINQVISVTTCLNLQSITLSINISGDISINIFCIVAYHATYWLIICFIVTISDAIRDATGERCYDIIHVVLSFMKTDNNCEFLFNIINRPLLLNTFCALQNHRGWIPFYFMHDPKCSTTFPWCMINAPVAFHSCTINAPVAFAWCTNHSSIKWTSSNGNIFRVTGHLCGEFTGPWWIPYASDVKLLCFLWSASE